MKQLTFLIPIAIAVALFLIPDPADGRGWRGGRRGPPPGGGGGAGAYTRAVPLFEEAVGWDPKQLTAWLNLGLLYKEKLRDKQKAIAAFQEFKLNGGKDDRVDAWLLELSR